MRNLLTKSFLFGEESAMVTYDDDTMEVLTWETKDHNGTFIEGTKLNCVYNFRVTISEKNVFKYDIDGVMVGYNLEDTCECIYRKYIEDGKISDSEWAHVNILSDEKIEPNVLEEIGQQLTVMLAQRYGGNIRVAVDNRDILDSPANVVIFYASDENYVIADRREVIPGSGTFGGGVFAEGCVRNSIHGTIEGDMSELSRVLHRIRRNDKISTIEFKNTDRGISVVASTDSGDIVRSIEIYGEKFKLGNK